ncbi:MAG: hypothetical protein EHM40_15380 [Chloroflexi bacterium]|nr:MAG: hypothetical protein EHM40_23055 [Chloroflexota bacterium]RPI91547.1 MAG: hypothetical protein EHM40_15380 [Chloroflexota bacterium]
MKYRKLFLSIVSLLFVLAVFVSLTGCSQSKSVNVEIAYRGHPPVQAVLKDVDALLVKYDQQVKVARYDVDTPEGETFLKGKEITDPTVLAIFIDDSMMYQGGSEEVQFFSFPVGRGTAMTAAGNWTLEDLDAALAQAINSDQ